MIGGTNYKQEDLIPSKEGKEYVTCDIAQYVLS